MYYAACSLFHFHFPAFVFLPISLKYRIETNLFTFGILDFMHKDDTSQKQYFKYH